MFCSPKKCKPGTQILPPTTLLSAKADSDGPVLQHPLTKGFSRSNPNDVEVLRDLLFCNHTIVCRSFAKQPLCSLPVRVVGGGVSGFEDLSSETL